MPLSPYFLQGSSSEQRLVQDLINEQLKIYGQDIVYLPRKIVNKKTIMKEVVASTFDDAYRMEAYLLNYQGFEGNGDILQKFGVQTTDAVTFVISKERYEDFISPFLNSDSQVELASRPEEGDLIYFPLDNTMFEIKYVEGKKPFYQCKNDSLDRFGTRLEKRFSKSQITEMLIKAGCKGVEFSNNTPFWCCVAFKK